MAKIIYIEFNGTEHTVDASPGETLMTVAVRNNILGIAGDCGENCACATCHLYVGDLSEGAADRA
ncbi:MAG: 2Fe-2S iron-sulfur cluster binding domain-containing protein [Gammaproteobacteria bacterium]|nr:2Fe-2S iron-sulfur cluster binding domain-containing protein [Gammaproteobacteria bacterium]